MTPTDEHNAYRRGQRFGRAAERSDVVAHLEQRVAWLDSEIRNGGDYSYLTIRYDEASYLLDQIRSAQHVDAAKKASL